MHRRKSQRFDVCQCWLGLRLRKGKSDGAAWQLAAPGSGPILKPFGSARPRGIECRAGERHAEAWWRATLRIDASSEIGVRSSLCMSRAVRNGVSSRRRLLGHLVGPSRSPGDSRKTDGRSLRHAAMASGDMLPETWRRPRSTAHSSFRLSRIVQIRRSMASSPSKMQTNSVAPAWPRR